MKMGESQDGTPEGLAEAITHLQRQAERQGCHLTSRLLSAAKDAVRWEARQLEYSGGERR